MWLALGTVAVLAVAFRVAMPGSRRDALLATAVAVASPVIGLNLAVITTDPPVLAFMLLALALSRRSRGSEGHRRADRELRGSPWASPAT